MATRDEWLAKFGKGHHAVRSAHMREAVLLRIALSLGTMPDCALRVYAGGEATAEYWDWLISKLPESSMK